MELRQDSPLSLEDAAKQCLGGYVKAATLRAAASRGELETEKLGRRIVTTPAAIQKWRELCREKAKARVCGSGQQGGSKRQSGSSETEGFSEALAAAKARVMQPSGTLENISLGNTTQPKEVVVLTKYRLPT